MNSTDSCQRRYVLDDGFVELVDMMPHPGHGINADLAVVNAARVSFLGESKGDIQDKRLLHYLLRNRHTSPFEQVVFKFHVRAPVVVWWQWVRHRTWSFNFQSGRYTEFEEDDCYIPKIWRRQSSSNKQASDGVLSDDDSAKLHAMLEEHCDRGYRAYQDAIGRGAAREMARLFLPGFGIYYEAIATIDAHNLLNFIRLRDHDHAQHEIRVYAQQLREIMNGVMPWTMEYVNDAQRT